jgi:hypothetical protein
MELLDLAIGGKQLWLTAWELLPDRA